MCFRIHTEAQNYSHLMDLLKACNDFFAVIPKAKTAKIVRTMLDLVGSVKNEQTVDVQISLSKDVITWCIAEKRTFLRQRIESKLAILLLEKKQAQECLVLINNLLKELRKLGKFFSFTSRINYQLSLLLSLLYLQLMFIRTLSDYRKPPHIHLNIFLWKVYTKYCTTCR